MLCLVRATFCSAVSLAAFTTGLLGFEVLTAGGGDGFVGTGEGFVGVGEGFVGAGLIAGC